MEKDRELDWGWGQTNRNRSGQNWLDILFTTAVAAGAAIAMGHHDSARTEADVTFRLPKHPEPSSLENTYRGAHAQRQNNSVIYAEKFAWSEL